jgi:hypothetical protein
VPARRALDGRQRAEQVVGLERVVEERRPAERVEERLGVGELARQALRDLRAVGVVL